MPPDLAEAAARRLLATGRSLSDLAAGRVPGRFLLCLLFPLACLCFGGGALLSLAGLPAGFDYGRCVVSRLCSRHHNPDGYRFLAWGMIATACLLKPFSAWLASHARGCPVLCLWGRKTMAVGLVSTAMVGAERAWFPTHFTRYENLHLLFAGVAFAGLWLGLAMFAGASGPPSAERVRWRWLLRPPWFLALSVLPIIVVFTACGPLNISPAVPSSLLRDWPKGLVFLRTLTFWQWYLVAGLAVGFAFSGFRACRQEKLLQADRGTWRVDERSEPSPHLQSLAEPASHLAFEAVQPLAPSAPHDRTPHRAITPELRQSA